MIHNNNGTISFGEIAQEIEKTSNSFKPVPHHQILDKLLDNIKPLNFKKEVFKTVYTKLLKELETLKRQAKKDPDDGDLPKQIIEKQKELEKLKVTRKHYKIICVDEILKLAEYHHWGLCQQHSFIYLYNGAYWKVLDTSELQTFLGDIATKMNVKRWDASDEKFVGDLLKQFVYKSQLKKARRGKKILINLQNGTFEVTRHGGKLRNFNRKDFLTYQLPFEYNPKAKAPLFQKYLNTVLPDVNCQYVLAEYLSYVFVRHLKLEKTLLLYGTGANGKSVFFEIVRALIGKENILNHPLHALTTKDHYRADLANALLNYGTEINGRLDPAIFKQLVSGEPVGACLKYKDSFTLENYARLIFNCNELPKDVEHTNAFFRRFLIIPFEVTIPEDEQDKELATKIIDNELSGVFNWVLDGLTRLLKQKNFTKSNAIQKQIDQYRKESDSVQLFLDEARYIPSLEKTESLDKIYKLYKEYTKDGLSLPESKKVFSKRLKAQGFVIVRKNYGNAIYIQRTQEEK